MLTRYSEHFETLYDERQATTDIGRGCHYSILRATFLTPDGKEYLHDFAVVWDEDHDTRIIGVLEDLYHAQRLQHFIVFGERKGSFSAIFTENVPDNIMQWPKHLFIHEREINSPDGDYWVTESFHVDDVERYCSLIQDSPERGKKYVAQIIQKYNLNKKAAEHKTTHASPKKESKSAGTPKTSPAAAAKQKADKKENKSAPATAPAAAAALSSPPSTNKAKKLSVSKHTITKNSRMISLYGFKNEKAARKKEIAWQQNAIIKFFRIGKPLDHKKRSGQLYSEIKKQLAQPNAPIKLDGICRRSLLIALTKLLSKQEKIPTILFSVGTTQIKLVETDATSQKRQIGNCKMEIVNEKFPIAYGDGLIKRLAFMVNKDDESKEDLRARRDALLSLIATKIDKMIPFTTQDFNQSGHIKRTVESSIVATGNNAKTIENVENHVHLLNGLIFLITIVEVIVRLYRDATGKTYDYADPDAKVSDQLPVASAQARSLILLLEGKIKFKDFFGVSDEYKANEQRAKFGLVTGKKNIDHIDILLEKLLTINSAYDKYTSEKPDWIKFKEKYLSQHPKGTIIPGRSHMYINLRACYGAGSESDNEAYSSSDDELEVSQLTPS